MELSHVISDFVLAAVAFFVFFKYLRKLDTLSTILWESFVLSVAIAAVLGGIRYAGYSQAGEISAFFQKIAATVGALGLLTASYQLVSGKKLSSLFGYVVIGIGFILLAITEFMDFTTIRNNIALICLPLVAILGVWALVKGKLTVGLLLIAAVAFAAAAVFTPQYLTNAADGIDAYHYLLATAVLCFGLAASHQPKFEEVQIAAQ
ncbi:MAG: hypothetical protein NWP83_07960 [Spirosomaceae bacterium]|nr:hypothetical protein [Spirosomataceae bacterium]